MPMYTDLTADIEAICRRIDGGDDGALPILADALEEAGEPMAAGLRQVGDRRAAASGGLWLWYKARCGGQHTDAPEAELPPAAFHRLRGWHDHSAVPTGDGGWAWCRYYHRSAAYLALAAALAQEG